MQPDPDQAADDQPDETEDVAAEIEDAPIGPDNETPESQPEIGIGGSLEF